MVVTDPIEKIVADALDEAGVPYTHDSEGGQRLDFELANGVAIEVKQFSTPRTSEQIADVQNVIVIQGREAAEWFASLLRDGDGS